MIQIVEVAARDGLQNDPATLTTDQKVELITRAVDAGIRRLEVASFVNPKAVPRMADAEAVVEALPEREGVSWIGLVLNVRGFERAAKTTIHEVNMVVASSETFAQRNQGMGLWDTVAVVEEVAPLALEAGLVPTVTVSTSFGCPFEGEVPLDTTRAMVERLASSGVTEIALADTIGAAVPADVRRRVAIAQELTAGTDIVLRTHFHNTRNTGYANALAAVEAGVTVLDSSLGGIGGCPFAPKATGNIATEDLVFLLQRSGFETGVDLDKLLAASAWLGEQLGRNVPSLVAAAGVFPMVAA